MSSSFTNQLLQELTTAPTEEIVKEEVVVVKEANVDNLIYKMVELASYLFHLNIQAHLIHLNLEAPYFLAVHKFLKKQYEQHVEDFDTLAELVRSMDYLLPMCQKGLLGQYKNFKTTNYKDIDLGRTLHINHCGLSRFWKGDSRGGRGDNCRRQHKSFHKGYDNLHCTRNFYGELTFCSCSWDYFIVDIRPN